MKFEIPPLPYPKDALEPHLSAETLELHYEKHHKGYLEKLRKNIEGKPEAERSLEDLIRTADGDLFNDDELLGVIESSFGGFERFRERFTKAANGEFGSGWAWLVKDATGRLSVRSSSDAENPLQRNLTPLLTLDVWEHAYYVDYRNERARYVETFLDHLLNWDFVASNLALAPTPDAEGDIQGEGNRDADRRYREGATAFAESGQVEPAARRAARDPSSA